MNCVHLPQSSRPAGPSGKDHLTEFVTASLYFSPAWFSLLHTELFVSELLSYSRFSLFGSLQNFMVNSLILDSTNSHFCILPSTHSLSSICLNICLILLQHLPKGWHCISSLLLPQYNVGYIMNQMIKCSFWTQSQDGAADGWSISGGPFHSHAPGVRGCLCITVGSSP